MQYNKKETVFAIEKLEYSRYNARTKYELVYYSTYSSDLLSYTNGSREGFVGVLCDWSFQVLGYPTMDEGIRSKKSLSLGMPLHPKLLSKNEQTTKLGDAPEWHPLFLLTTISILLEAIFLFVTYYVFCLERLVWYESLLVLFCVLSFDSLLDTPILESQNYVMTC